MSSPITLIAQKEERVDKYISNELKISRAYVEELINERKIKVNGHIPKKKDELSLGDFLEIEEYQPKEIDIVGSKMDLDIIYEDEDILVINKKRGVVVHPAPGNYTDTIVNGLLYLNKHLSVINGKYRPGIVHRIDKDTSGIIIVAKNNIAHNKLAEDFKSHDIKRKYIAIVIGELSEATGTIDLPIARDPSTRIKMTVAKNGRPAKTNYKVLERLKGYTLVECSLETGRTHQIRVHFSYMKHPLVGDHLYGSKKDKFPLDGQYLHAFLLGINYPKTGEYMEFKGDIPEYFLNRLNEIRNGQDSIDETRLLHQGITLKDQVRFFIAISKNMVEEGKRRFALTPLSSAALGRVLTAASMMGMPLKGEDVLTITFKGDGPLGDVVSRSNSLGGSKGLLP